jgi:acetyltransferase
MDLEREVRVRPVRPDDEQRYAAFLAQLSAETSRLRFPGGRGDAGELAHSHTHVDYDRHMAFVAESEGRIVGEARYVANPGGRSCEIGIAVADDWRHSGLARLLMQALAGAARERGFERLKGLVLRENTGMLDFVRGFGFEIDPAPGDQALVRIALPLTQVKPGEAARGIMDA